MSDGPLPNPVYERPSDRPTPRPQRPTKFGHAYNVCRNTPGQWYLVAEYKKGGPKATTRMVYTDKRLIEKETGRRWPLEVWRMRIRTAEGSWNHRKLYLMFEGTITAEEREERRRKSRALYDRNQAIAAERRTQRALEARLAAMREQAENRASSPNAG